MGTGGAGSVAMRASGIAAGAVVAGRYRIVRPIASGGMGKVLEATDMQTGEAVAIKLLHPDIGADPVNVERFIREGTVLAAVDHPNVVEILDTGALEDGTLFIAMELLTGETLAQYLKVRRRLSPEELVPIVRDVCEGLDTAHALGIVHRDLKPSNIVLTRHGDQDRSIDAHGAKLLDFGVSQLQGADRLTRTGEIMGTPRYMAPEQLAASRNVSPRSDVYSLGVILYEALSGSAPFQADNAAVLIVNVLRGEVVPIRKHLPNLPQEIERVIHRAMALSPDGRYPSAPALTEAYEAAVGGGRVSLIRATAPQPTASVVPETAQRAAPAAQREKATQHLPIHPTGLRSSGSSHPVLEMPAVDSHSIPPVAPMASSISSQPPRPIQIPTAASSYPPQPLRPSRDPIHQTRPQPATKRGVGAWVIVLALTLVLAGAAAGAIAAYLIANS